MIDAFYNFKSMDRVRRPLSGGLTEEAMNNCQKLFIHEPQREGQSFHDAETSSTRANAQ